MTEREFKAWLAKSKTGDTAVYHVGHLAFDSRENVDLARVGARAYLGMQRGFLTLVQRRVAGRREYLAIAREGAHRARDLMLNRDDIAERAGVANGKKLAA